MRSVQGGGIQTRGWFTGLDEVSQDPEDLGGVGDDRDESHRLVTARAAQRIRIVDLLDQSSPRGPLRGPWAWMVAARPSWPGGAGLLLGDGQVRLLLVGLAEVGGGLQGVLLFPALGGEVTRTR